MGLDLRLPIGMMFSIIGAMLVLYGVFTSSDQAMYAASLGMNINLWWGLVLLVFGGLMLFFAWRAPKAGNSQ
jgi:protein-S-isoprenylcysteine O-methyltransferase Ste14